jgi:hypothetical protein
MAGFSDEALAEAFSDCWRHPLDFVAEKHGSTEDMLGAPATVISTPSCKNC